MISIDQNAYGSKLRKIDPRIKMVTSLTVLSIALIANSYLVSGIIIFSMGWFIVNLSGTKPSVLLKLMLVPSTFIILSMFSILIERSDNPNIILMPVKVSSMYYGLGINNFDLVGRLMFKSVAAILCMYFLALTTPMIELFSSLRQLKLPKLFVELMELIYRFIFILIDTANKIYVAQSSRLGYNSFKSSFKSFGVLASMLFVKSYKRSDRMYIALQSRGYDGEINTITFEYEQNLKYYLFSGIFIALLIIIAIVESAVLK